MRSDLDSMPVILINGAPVPVKIRVNRRAKRLIIKVDPLNPAILLTCPSKGSVRDGLSFARERVAWIADQLAEAPERRPFKAGALIPVQGIDHRIIHVRNQKRSLEIRDTPPIIAIGGDLRHLPRRLEDWLRRKARKEFCLEADKFCAELGVQRKRISIRDTRTRWGSCSSDGAISFSWRLVMAPRYVYQYVVAHEVAHLKHMDHSPAFWKTVDTLIDDRRNAQDWLGTNGNELYAFGGSVLPADAAAA